MFLSTLISISQTPGFTPWKHEASEVVRDLLPCCLLPHRAGAPTVTRTVTATLSHVIPATVTWA